MSTAGPQDSPTWPPPPQDRVAPPPPTATPDPVPSRTRPSRRPRRIAIFAAGALVAAGAGTAVALSGGHRVEQRETLAHPITALTVDGTGGDVTVRSGATTGTVEVVRRGPAPRNDGALPGATTWDGASTLVLRPDCSGGCDVDYQVTVPDGVAVTVHTGSGDIELNGTLGTISLQTGSGDIDADVSSDTVTLHTGNGDADLRLRDAPDQVTASSGSGDIDIRVPKGETYQVTHDTGSGDVDLNVQQGQSDHVIQVRTGSGDISVDDS